MIGAAMLALSIARLPAQSFSSTVWPSVEGRRVRTFVDDSRRTGGDVHDMHVARDGSAWFIIGYHGQNSVVHAFDDGSTETIAAPPNRMANALTIASDGSVWVGYVSWDRTAPSGVVRYDPGGYSRFFPGPGSGPADGLWARPDGRIWFVRSGRGEVGTIDRHGRVDIRRVSRELISRAAVSNDGALWVAWARGAQVTRVGASHGVRTFTVKLPQIDVLAAGPGGGVYLGRATFGTIVRLGPSGAAREVAVSFGGIERMTYDGTGLWLTLTEQAPYSELPSNRARLARVDSMDRVAIYRTPNKLAEVASGARRLWVAFPYTNRVAVLKR